MASFHPARREKLKLRLAIDGPSGSGKTYTLLRFAFALGERVAVIDTESRSASKYQGLAPDGIPWNFDVLELQQFAPTQYTEAIQEAGRLGYEVLVIDSLSHAWSGEGGALELKDRQGGNSFTAWKTITPMHNRLVESILKSPCHVLVSMRSKTEYVLETNEQGKQVPRKIGMAPIQRPGMEYEFDVYGSMDWTHTLSISKSRCPELQDAVAVKPGASFMAQVVEWLNLGTAPSQPEIQSPPRKPAAHVTEEQVQVLREFAEHFEWDPASIVTRLRKAYNVDRFELLNQEQAQKLINALIAKYGSSETWDLDARAEREAIQAEGARG